jgi:hypothetical protein
MLFLHAGVYDRTLVITLCHKKLHDAAQPSYPL